MTLSVPLQTLNAGSILLLEVLAPHGFTYEQRSSGCSSGGDFATGEFTCGERRLEVHFRHSLGQVQYHYATHTVRHEPYMRKLGVLPECRFPGFTQEALQGFQDLAHDLHFAVDFMSGDARILIAAAIEQKAEDCVAREALLAGYQGQAAQVAEMRSSFKQGKYSRVLAIFQQLPAPHLLTASEIRLVDIARQRDT